MLAPVLHATDLKLMHSVNNFTDGKSVPLGRSTTPAGLPPKSVSLNASAMKNFIGYPHFQIFI